MVHTWKNQRNPETFRRLAAAAANLKDWQIQSKRAALLRRLARSSRPYIIASGAALAASVPGLLGWSPARLEDAKKYDHQKFIWVPSVVVSWKSSGGRLRKMYKIELLPVA